jgi:heme exporter protein CcmD
MSVNSISGLWELGGYGVYVWPAYGLSLLALALEAWTVRLATRQALALAAEVDA